MMMSSSAVAFFILLAASSFTIATQENITMMPSRKDHAHLQRPIALRSVEKRLIFNFPSNCSTAPEYVNCSLKLDTLQEHENHKLVNTICTDPCYSVFKAASKCSGIAHEQRFLQTESSICSKDDNGEFCYPKAYSYLNDGNCTNLISTNCMSLRV